MKKLLLLGALLAAGASTLPNTGYGHGGTYVGPGDTVPPGGSGNPPSAGPPSTPGPNGPAPPGPSGPSTPGNPGPGPPGPNGGPAITGRTNLGPDLSSWEFWWAFNKAPYLNLRAAIHDGLTITGTSDVYLGPGQRANIGVTYAPSETTIRERIVPALIAALKTERDNDIVTACLIALARIGDERGENGVSELEELITGFLSDPVQEIAETAAIALGILGDSASIGVLEHLALDTAEGRRLVGDEGGVDVRTRAFAAYGLGLVGSRTPGAGERERIVQALHALVEAGRGSSRDLQVAALIATGLVPLDAGHLVPEVLPEPVVGAPPLTREEQILWLLDFFGSDDERRSPYLVRAHAPRAVAQLLEGADPRLLDRAREAFLAPLTRRGSRGRSVLRQSCALALGSIGDLDLDPGDVAVRRALMNGVRDPDQPVKSFCLVALAQIAGRPGTGDGRDEGIGEVRAFLLRQLARGRSAGRPWAALALGILERARYDLADIPSPDTLRALQDVLEKESAPRIVGSCAIALGIAGDDEAEDLLTRKLGALSDGTARGHLAVGLGLMGAVGATEEIQTIVRNSKYRGDLLRESAIALGLLRDKQAVTILVGMLEDEGRSLATQAAIATALGFIGDRRCVDPLLEMLSNAERTTKARAFAAAALGLVADREMLPWNSRISIDINYLANTMTLTGGGKGILDLL